MICRDAIVRQIGYPTRALSKVRLENKRIIGPASVKHPIGRVSPYVVGAGSSIVPSFKARFDIGHLMLPA